jgi:TolB-like protein/DNA-binding winged helix-turn-helix (wHTH) protein/Tfp pilus assembly protein PilF
MDGVSQQSLSAGHAVYRVGDLTIDTGRQIVARGTDEIPVPKLSFNLLLVLVRAAPDLVSLDRLMQEVWPKRVVSPETVSQRVKLLRDTLDDDPRSPRYIAGLRGRGYRIVAPVTCISSQHALEIPAEASAVSPAAPPRSAWTTARVWWTSAASLIALVLMMIASVLMRSGGGSSRDASRREVPPPTPTPHAQLHDRTVAVLPFEALSGEAPDEFVALGIAEGVMHRLAEIRDITLIARSSSFAFRGKQADARDIGLKLKARYLVAGTVQRSGDRLRVTAQLIDAASGANVQSLQFEHTAEDIFGAQDEISTGVARALEVNIPGRAHPFARFGIDAYLAYVQGRALVATRKVSDAERAIRRFSRAIALAPDFAAAYVDLADAHVYLAHLKGASDSSAMVHAAYAEARPLLERALQLDSSLGEAYVLRADLKHHAGDVSGAEADYRHGLTLSPNYGRGHESFAQFLEQRGRREEALREIDRARIVDPLTPRNHYLKGLMLQAWGSAREAEALYLQTLEIAPDFYPALTRLAQIRGYREKRYAEAVNLAEQAAAIDPRAPWVLANVVELYLELEDVEAARNFALQQMKSAQPTLWLPICLFQRQPQRAADILRANPDRWTEREDVEAYVIRDAALASGRPDRARLELPRLPSPELGGLYGTIALAQVNVTSGDRREGERLAHRVLEWQTPTLPLAVTYPQAIALALLGRKESAIDQLENAYRRGRMVRWWYVFEREPAFATVRDASRFQTLAAQARARVAAQRRLLEQMRDRGEVPRRAPTEALKAAPC